jgi:hypothetical protein
MHFVDVGLDLALAQRDGIVELHGGLARRTSEVPMRVILLLFAVLLSVAACAGSTAGLASSSSPLDGNWRTAPAVPSGSGIDLSLATTGLIVTGTGHEYALQYLRYSFTISGQQGSDGTTFSLTFASDSGAVFTTSGHMVGSDEFRLAWALPTCTRATGCGGRDSLTFVREPQ